MKRLKRSKLSVLLRQFMIALGIVLIWRGLWNLLDFVDRTVFNGNHSITTVFGLIIGLLILYLPDHDLKELGKL